MAEASRRRKDRAPSKDRKARGNQPSTSESREIYGIAAIAIALVLALALARGSSGVLTGPVAWLLTFALGLGAYATPVLLIAWGVTFFIKAVDWREGNVALGLGVMLVAAIGMAHMQAAGAYLGRAGFGGQVFALATLGRGGGVIGAALAYGLSGLLGTAASWVVLVAGFLAGAVYTGFFSVSTAVVQVTNGVKKVAQARAADKADGTQPPLKGKAAVRERLARVGEAEASGRASRPAERPEPAFTTTFDAQAGKPTEQLLLAAVPQGEGYHLPPVTLLKRTKARPAGHKRTVEEYKRLLLQTLADFDVEATVEDVIVGPTVTVFEIAPAPGVKVTRVQALSGDIGLALATNDVRIAPIPGKSALGVEVPNEARDLVTLGDVLASPQAASFQQPLAVAIGKDTSGNAILADLGDMPHLLIAGATGQGKSVAINAILVTLLMRVSPEQVRLILIDPKRIELAAYRELPHLLVPVTAEAKKAANALGWAVTEMEIRYKQLEQVGARKLDQYNALVAEAKDPRTEGLEPLPYIVIVIDELADLMMVSSADVEGAVQRLSQMARAVGIHLVLATQRPSTDVITGLIKANITTRIAMKVSSSIDSRVVLDSTGAEKLVGKGDMLLMQPERGKPLRVQGAFVSEAEIEQVTAFIRDQAQPEYQEEILAAQAGGGDMDLDDEMLEPAIQIVLQTQMGSTSMLQRRLKLGYTRAARLMDMMEQLGIVGPPDGSKPREVLVDLETWEIMKGEGREEDRP